MRDEHEYASGHPEGAVHIPLNELRERLGEIDKTRPVWAYCKVGQRGYNATRILRQHGFDAAGMYRAGSLCGR